MEPKRGAFLSRSTVSVAVLFVALLFLMGCAPSAVSKPQGQTETKGQGGIGAKGPGTTTPKQAGLTPSPRPPTSSLEAYQKGILGKEGARGALKDVHFDFDRYDLRVDAQAILKAAAGWLKANSSVRVEIEGHADERGTNEYNLALGAKRAESVKRYLIDLGVPAGRFSTITYGEELPICKERSEDCWAKNRRAHFAMKTAPTS